VRPGLLQTLHAAALKKPNSSDRHCRQDSDGLSDFICCRYLVSLIASDAEGVHTDLNEFGLEAMNIALNAGGAGENAAVLSTAGLAHCNLHSRCEIQPLLPYMCWKAVTRS
jgi:hypothetical protein